MANDPDSGLDEKIIESPYMLDRFMKNYAQRRKQKRTKGKEGKIIQYG